MRFFKYLVLIFVSIISLDAIAAEVCVYKASGDSTGYDSLSGACASIFKITGRSEKDFDCKLVGARISLYTKGTNSSIGQYGSRSCVDKCPPSGSIKVFWYPAGTTTVPKRVCDDGCTYEGGHAIDTNNYVSVTMQATGGTANCTNENQPKPPPTCNKADPYGGCYVPPKDDCMRLSDGSIQCPPNQPPPNNNTCNGADYCKRPPEGCGPGYVPGSFNGEQLCVRSGPNVPKEPPEPDNPDDPNNCMNGGSYCPQPPDNTSCPSGYTETTFNGSKICVKNNPDPEKPNPNDPNNNDGGGGASEPNGGGGDGSTGGSVNLKPVIDAINALKSALLQAIDSVSKKITTLVDGQKKTNETLDKSNKHLEKIEESTQAVSESTAQTNEKLDDVKDAIEGQYKCNNNSYNPNDPHSSKYRECTESDLPFPNSSSPSDTNIDIGDISVGDYESNYVSWSAQCPPDNHISINLMGQSSTLVLSWSPWCELLSKIRWAIIACAYFAAAYIILGMR